MAVATAGNYPAIDRFIESLPSLDGALIPVLHMAQEEYGFLSREVQLYIAHKLGIPASKVYGVTTFYSLFTMERRGQYRINICLGTACFVKGATTLIDEFEKELKIKKSETTEDYLFTLDAVRCIGTCGLAPAVMVNDKVYGRVTPEDVKSIVEEYLSKGGGGGEN
jgi:NADH-quinone oxidoreductase subunit E/NADP-reducing hydrogenase subunit HndA